MRAVAIYLAPSEPPRPCAAVEVMDALAAEGRLPQFLRAFGAYRHGGPGNCHDCALGLLADLRSAHQATGWVWCYGWCRIGPNECWHSWLEHDGWAVDGACGKLLVMDAGLYREEVQAGYVISRDTAETEAFLSLERKLPGITPATCLARPCYRPVALTVPNRASEPVSDVKTTGGHSTPPSPPFAP